MKKFAFRLQKVLDHREAEKKDEERNLATKHAELHAAELHLDRIVDEQDNIQLPSDELITMAELALCGDYSRALRDALEEQRRLVEEATEAVAAARDVYIEKAMEAETISTLRDRRKKQWEDEKKKKEKKQVDEMIIQRHRFSKEQTETGGDDE